MTKTGKTFIATAIIISAFLVSCSNNTKEASAPIQEIPVFKVIKHDVPIYSFYIGQIYGAKDIPIRARVEGFLESMDFEEGSKVKKGQLLYTIDPQSLQAASNVEKSKVAEAQTNLALARADLDRIKPLAELKAVSQSDLDGAQAAYDAALSSLRAAKANLESSDINLSYTNVLSPIDGVIGKTNARVGEFVGREPNPVILNTVSEISSVIVKFNITESEFIGFSRRFSMATDVQREEREEDRNVELELADGSTYAYPGKIDFIDRNIDVNTGSILVQASFDNPNFLLRPGLYSKVKIQTDLKKDALIIPQRCIMELQGQYSAYVVTDSNKVEARQITVAYKSGDLAAITDGLKEGDQVVIDALQKVKSGMEVTPVPTDFKSKVFKLNKE